MTARKISRVYARRTSGSNVGRLFFGAQSVPCIFGRGGLSWRKREGDGATPRGRFKILAAMVRSDRGWRSAGLLPTSKIQPASGWCDDASSFQYNRLCKATDKVRHEDLWRSDHVYDVVLILDYNIHPRKIGAGSAIFFHLTMDGRSPTAGCVAIKPADMRRLLSQLGAQVYMTIS